MVNSLHSYCMQMLIINLSGSGWLRFFLNIRRSGQILWVPVRKSAPSTTLGILYRIIFYLTHKDLIMDSITIFPNNIWQDQ